MGPQGMTELGTTVLARTAYGQQQVAAIDGVALRGAALHLRDFMLYLSVLGTTAAEVVTALRARGSEPGVVINGHSLLVRVSGCLITAHIDILVSARTVFQKEK